MTKYTIFPCTDDTWVKVFRRIRKVAKETGMRIIQIDGKTNSKENKVVFKNPFNIKKDTELIRLSISDVPDYTTTIILEKQDERSIRRRRKIGES